LPVSSILHCAQRTGVKLPRETNATDREFAISTLINADGRYDIAAQEDRCAPRTKIVIPAQLRASGMRAFQTVVNDLSLSSFSATAVTRMHPGSICWLSLPGLESLQAEVVWWENGNCGCAFSNLLSPIVHDNILARYRGDGVYRG